mgnify:FL=1
MKDEAWDVQLIEMCLRCIGPGFSRFGLGHGQVSNAKDQLFGGLWDLTVTDVPPESVVFSDRQTPLQRFAQSIREHDRNTSGHQRAKL